MKIGRVVRVPRRPRQIKERCYCCGRVESPERKVQTVDWDGRLRMICDECVAGRAR